MKMIDELFAKRVFERIDKFDEKIDDLCDRMLKVEIDITNHLNTVTQNAEKKREEVLYNNCIIRHTLCSSILCTSLMISMFSS